MYNLSQYIYQVSTIHSRDPRVKIIAVLTFSIVILQLNGIGLLIAAGLVTVCSHLAHIFPGTLIRASRPVWPFFLGLFLMYLFFTPGQPLPGFPIGPVQISEQGLYTGIIQISRFLLLVLAASLLTMTTTESELTLGLETLLRPLSFIGISSHDIAMMISLALRFFPVLANEMNDIREAQLARGANFNPRQLGGKVRAISYMAAPLSINLFRRCDELVDAMEARGYKQGHRTYLQDPVMDQIDCWVLCSIMLFLLAAIISRLHPLITT